MINLLYYDACLQQQIISSRIIYVSANRMYPQSVNMVLKSIPSPAHVVFTWAPTFANKLTPSQVEEMKDGYKIQTH